MLYLPLTKIIIWWFLSFIVMHRSALLCKEWPQSFASLNKTHLVSPVLSEGLESEQLSWAVWAQGLPRGCCHAVGQVSAISRPSWGRRVCRPVHAHQGCRSQSWRPLETSVPQRRDLPRGLFKHGHQDQEMGAREWGWGSTPGGSPRLWWPGIGSDLLSLPP